MNFKFTVIKKNQILAVAVTMMLVMAGYLNYRYDPTRPFDVELTGKIEDNLGDAIFVNSTNIEEDAVEVFAKDNEDYFVQTRIDRANTYAEQIEIYENIIMSDSVSEEQKSKAQEEINRINETRNSITIAENLIKLKGFDEVVILVNTSSVNVIVEDDELSKEQLAQIQNIVSREFDVEIDTIHITNKWKLKFSWNIMLSMI